VEQLGEEHSGVVGTAANTLRLPGTGVSVPARRSLGGIGAPRCAHMLERCRHACMARVALRSVAQVCLRFLEPPLLKAQEAEALSRTDVGRGDAQDGLPRRRCAIQLSAIDRDAGEQIVRVGVAGMTLDPARGNSQCMVELPLAPQRFGEREKDQAGRISRELVTQAPDLVTHPCHRR
jgi:hypothetical protein